MADKKKAPDGATSKAQPKSVVAIDTPHIAQGARDDKPLTSFQSREGHVWTYHGKRARVLAMLVNAPNGVTQWDTLPWHTRLGGTIHAMREDGLAISTEHPPQNGSQYALCGPSSSTLRGASVRFPPKYGAIAVSVGDVFGSAFARSGPARAPPRAATGDS